MTLTIECAFRLAPSGVEFRLDDDPPEDEMCELQVFFGFRNIYAPERDSGSGVTWDTSVILINFRALGEPWRSLTDDERAARTFLETHCHKAMDEAEREAALESYYGS